MPRTKSKRGKKSRAFSKTHKKYSQDKLAKIISSDDISMIHSSNAYTYPQSGGANMKLLMALPAEPHDVAYFPPSGNQGPAIMVLDDNYVNARAGQEGLGTKEGFPSEQNGVGYYIYDINKKFIGRVESVIFGGWNSGSAEYHIIIIIFPTSVGDLEFSGNPSYNADKVYYLTPAEAAAYEIESAARESAAQASAAKASSAQASSAQASSAQASSAQASAAQASAAQASAAQASAAQASAAQAFRASSAQASAAQASSAQASAAQASAAQAFRASSAQASAAQASSAQASSAQASSAQASSAQASAAQASAAQASAAQASAAQAFRASSAQASAAQASSAQASAAQASAAQAFQASSAQASAAQASAAQAFQASSAKASSAQASAAQASAAQASAAQASSAQASAAQALNAMSPKAYPFSKVVYAGNNAAASSPVTTFSAPHGLTTDSTGNPWVTDYSNSVIKRFTPTGVVTIGVEGSPGLVDSANGPAKFNNPMGIVFDRTTLACYVADTGNNVVRKIDNNNIVTTVAGGAAGAVDGPAKNASFNGPRGITADGNSNLYIADSGNHRIRRFDLKTGIVTTIAGSTSGFSDGAGVTAAKFNTPTDIAVDFSNTNLYIVDSGNNCIRKMNLSTGEITTVAGSPNAGSSDGVASAARFNGPFGITIDGLGLLYVADTNNNSVRLVDTTNGEVKTIVSGLSAPRGVSIYMNNIYISESTANSLQRIVGPTSMMIPFILGTMVSFLKDLNVQYLSPASQTTLASYLKSLNDIQVTRSSGGTVVLSDMLKLQSTVDSFLDTAQREIQTTSGAQASQAQASQALVSSAQASTAQASSAEASATESKTLSNMLSSLNELDTTYLASGPSGTQSILNTHLQSINKMQNTLSSGSLVPSSELDTFFKLLMDFVGKAKDEIKTASSAQASSAQASSAQASSAQVSGAAIPKAQYNILTKCLDALNKLTFRYLPDDYKATLTIYTNTVTSWLNYTSYGNMIGIHNFEIFEGYVGDFIEASNKIIQNASRAEISGAQASAAQVSGAQASQAQASQAQVSGAEASKAQASQAQVSGAEASKAQASQAQVSGAQASQAQASQAQVSGAQASQAQASATQASQAQASAAQASQAQASQAQASAAKIPQYGEDTVSYGEQETAYGENPEVVYGEAQATYGEAPVNNTEAGANYGE